MSEIADCWAWAEAQFGECNLGDVRRTRRLVRYAARQAIAPRASVNAVSGGDTAFREGAYRLLENDAVSADDILDGIFSKTVEDCSGRPVILAIQDTTSVSLSHGAVNELGEITTPESTNRGLLAHTSLCVDGETSEVIGLLDQARWVRPKKRVGRDNRKSVPYKKKESFKWEQAAQRGGDRLGEVDRLIWVCDREADVYEYLRYLASHGHRFVVRAAYNRCVSAEEGHLWEHLERQEWLGSYDLYIEQRGAMHGGKHHAKRKGRKARVATLNVTAAPVTLVPSAPSRHDDAAPLPVTAVLVRESPETSPSNNKPIEWMLLTTERVETFEDACVVIGHYEKRWLIEQFHKCWKSGCRLEQRPVQSRKTLERLMAVLAAIAVRLLRLKTLAEANPKASASTVLDRPELECLKLLARQRGDRIPKKLDVGWVYKTLGMLAGWTDSKKTGRVGWETLWNGYNFFQTFYAGWAFAQSVRK